MAALNVETRFIEALHELKLRPQNWDNLIIYSQAYLETGAFSSDLAIYACNFWGIKWNSGSDFAYYEKQTKEFVDGKEVTITAKFKKYEIPIDGINNYIDIIRKHYNQSFNHRNEYKEYFKGLQTGTELEPWRKWSTSPTYADTCIKTYERLNRPEFYLLINEVKT